MKRYFAGAAVFATLAFSQQTLIYKDPSAPIEKRIDDLVSRMSLEEKVSQLMNDSPAIDRLGIPAYNWWNECLHGVARAGRATVFPEAIGLAATWDQDLMLRVATAISDEARAKHHEALRRGEHSIYEGLTFWTPNINLFRDPRWGRGMETYGEDPYLTARMAVQFIRGLQGDDPKYLKTVATAKHYAVHSGPESTRHTFDAVVSETDLDESYLPHFEAAIKEGGAYSVMCAYNSVDGKPACANPRLLDDILRKQWGFQGYIVSDCGAIEDIYRRHKFVPTAEEGVALAVKAGTDLSCGTEYTNLVPAVKKGLIAEAEIDVSLKRLLRARFRLGMFDPPEMVKYAQIPYSVNDSPAHRELALETARKSIVLLKNEHTLPLSKSVKTVAVIGPNADDVDVLLGNYNGIPTAPITPLEGIRRKLGAQRVIYARGSELAAGVPNFEAIPQTALFTSNGPDRKPGLTGEYYNSCDFDGKPHRPRARTATNPGVKPVFTRIDPQIDFEWWENAPRQEMNPDDFGVTWSGYITAPATGTYQIGAIGMNAWELSIDGKQIVQFTGIHEGAYRYAPVELKAGTLYPVRLAYHEFSNDASIRLVWSRPVVSSSADAVAAAKQSDAVILVLGLSPRLEGEEMKVPVEGFSGGDRVDLGIPRTQEDLMKAVVAMGKPTVLVLLNGSAVAINWAAQHVPAIVEAWYPGQAGGDAIADVVFGDYNPAGRLPVTFYKSADQLPPFDDYSMKGRTYRFFSGEPLFPFGFGLSYTTFAYRNLKRAGDKVTVEVLNTGTVAGEEVAQLYAKGSVRSLAGFQRLTLLPKQRKTVQFTLPAKNITEISVGGGQAGPNTSHLTLN
ncbi:MAG TPA: glycoside hydrolase family 3 C-terminal domain-containing protein [Bryobacteraceae bacterium]|nr:glycoside hydrolase family 3 C-terminal domain-containing protein [Bryobacteraceae bacterium]